MRQQLYQFEILLFIQKSHTKYVRDAQFALHWYKTDVPYLYQQSLSGCITCQDLCIQQFHAAKRLNHRDLKCIFESSLLCYYYAINQRSPTFSKLRATSCVPINSKGYYSFIHASEIKILLNLPLITLVLIFVNVKSLKTLIMLILFLEQARGRPACSLRATWCPRAPRW